VIPLRADCSAPLSLLARSERRCQTGGVAIRVLFDGTPWFALPALEALLAAHEVVGVGTQPTRPAGRGQHLSPKEWR